MPSDAQFSLSGADRKVFAGTFLLSHMRKEKLTYDVLLPSEVAELGPTLEWLLMKGLVELNKKHHYALTTKGSQRARAFGERYQALLTYFDLFSAVDLESGEFAFARFPDFSSTNAWQKFLSEERWEDLRVPMMEYLGGSAIELVFCQFVQEDRLICGNDFWSVDLLIGSIWDEILSICNSALRQDQLGFMEEGGQQISGETVLSDVREQGFLLLRELNPSDPGIHSNLQAWYPRHGYHNLDLPVPLPGWEKPIWRTPWSLD